jgi:predicted RNA-binding Zn-ribbon protein involved in translation (DUF1610 family)
MTLVNRACFDPTDIRAIQLECNACFTTISFKPEEWKSRQLSCPNCGDLLIAKSGSAPQSAEFLAVDGLVDVLKTFRAPNSFKFSLPLEFDQVG